MPSIVFWTRLEPYARRTDIDTGLQARLHDPLWMLARQWQNGEFQGEDGGTPVQARLRMERAPLARYHPGPVGDASELPGVPYRADLPLEALVEREPVQLLDDPRRDLRLAAEAGIYFLRLLEREGAGEATRRAFVATPAYRLAAPADDPAGDEDRSGRAYLSVMAGRVPDGFALYRALAATLRPAGGGDPSLPAEPSVDEAERDAVLRAGVAFVDGFEARYTVPPEGTSTWNPERMEHAFAVSAAGSDVELALEAEEYPGGALDWYAFDLASGLRLGVGADDPAAETVTRTLLPGRVRYPGMAVDRWWEFEDAAVDFGRVAGDPDDLLRLLLVNFALVYGNDWYLVPVDLAPGAVYRPRSLVVTDAFGERTLVHHYSALDAAPHDWRLFSLTPRAGSSFSTSAARPGQDALFVPPVLATSLHGDPIEEVLFLRDELANLVWAVERLVPGLAGDAVNRVDAYHARPGASEPDAASEAASEASSPAELRYLLATSTPEHWIPFLPVRIDPDRPDVRLRRAATLLERTDGASGGLPALSRPLGRILEPERPDLGLFEEEAPRSGIRLTRAFQYARWIGGGTFLWLGRAKGPGKGESTAGLRFDQVE
jgi:hypothetical protein